jgi:hypothetical protein
MADQLDLAIVLKAVLDAKGFEEAQGKIKALASQANATKPALDKTADAGKKMGQELGGTRGPVADLTRLLLANVGATSQAGEAAKFLGEATTATAGGVSALALGAGALVVAASFVVPKLIEWFNKSEALNEEQRKLRDEIVTSLPELEKYAETVKKVSDSVQVQIEGARALALSKQREDLAKKTADLTTKEEELAALRRRNEEVNDRIFRNFGTYMNAPKALREEFEKSTEKETQLAATTKVLRGETEELSEAVNTGAVVERQRKEAMEAATRAEERQTKALREREAAQRALNEAFEEGERARRGMPGGSLQELLQKDSKALAEREAKAKKGKLDPEVERLLVLGDAEAHLAAERERLDTEEMERKRQEHKEKLALDASMVAGATQALASFFGNNKTARIASALADTWAGVARAQADWPWPYSAVVSGIVLAQGLANVSNIRKQEIGFDDPVNDLLAQKLGRKFATDVLSHIMFGFNDEMGGQSGGAGSSTVYDQRTYHQAGDTHNYGGIHGLMASSPTQFARGVDRVMVKAQRFRQRTTVGARRRAA